MGYRAYHSIKIAQKVSYLTNEITMEIHNLKNEHKNCMIDSIDYGVLIEDKDICQKYLDLGYKHCKWCKKETD